MGKVEYRFDQHTVWVQWPDGRRKEVKFKNKLTDERWQELLQAAVSGGPGRSGAVGIGGFAGAAGVSVGAGAAAWLPGAVGPAGFGSGERQGTNEPGPSLPGGRAAGSWSPDPAAEADAPTAAGPADPVSGSAGPFVEVGLPDGGAGVRLFGGGGVWHVWVGLVPDVGLMDRLVVSAGTVVVHGHGVGGGLGSSAGVAEALGVAKGASGAVQALLLACEQTGAQSFATGHGIAVEATRESVFVSPRDGGVFFGQAEVGADGRLTVVTRVVPEALDRFVPGGDGPVVVDRPLVVGLSREEVLAHPGPWVRRLGGSGGLDRAQPAVEGEPVGQGPPPPVAEEPFAEAPVEQPPSGGRLSGRRCLTSWAVRSRAVRSGAARGWLCRLSGGRRRFPVGCRSGRGLVVWFRWGRLMSRGGWWRRRRG